MKRFKINAMAAVAVVVAGATMAFTAPASQQWVFTGNSESQILDAGFYSSNIQPPQTCSGDALPCSIMADAVDQDELQDFLDTQTKDKVLNDAIGTRN